MKEDLSALIGNTKLVRLCGIEKEFSLCANLYAKVEFSNLTGSIKDRPALHIIRKAEESGLLKKGMPIIEATSGNMGISFAAIAQKLGYKAIIVMPENMTEERKALIKSYGAELVLTSSAGGMAESCRKASELAVSLCGYEPKQFENGFNAEAHYLSTGPEIFNELGEVSALVAGIGTGGTITGTGRYLKEKCGAKVIGVEPKSSPLLTKGYAGSHAIQGIGANFVPKVLDVKLLDEVIDLADDDAFTGLSILTRLDGLYGGISSGAAVYGAIQVAKREEYEGKNVVCVLPDGAEKYQTVINEYFK